MFWNQSHNNLLLQLLHYTRVGLIADMDGTLSHITNRPGDARVTPRNIALLHQLKSQLPLVAILSGRAAGTLRKLVGVPGLVYVGNHGLERWSEGQVHVLPEAEAYRAAVQQAYQALLPYAKNGVFLENKTVTLSLHYRQTSSPASTAEKLRTILERVAADHDLALFQGRMVYELRPPIPRNKGSALESLVNDYRLDGALFMGDDTTDIPALEKARELRENQRCFSIGAGVVSPESPPGVKANADILVKGVDDVEKLLDWLQQSYTASAT